MSKRRSIGRKKSHKGNRNTTFHIEGLESRQLLSSVTYGTPISTALPNGFVPLKAVHVILGENFGSGNLGVPTGGFAEDQNLVIIGASGGAVLEAPNTDGTFGAFGTISPSLTVIGAADTQDSQGDGGLVVFTTTGYMVQQSNNSFSAPTGYTLPADAVAGDAVVGRGFSGPSGVGPGLIIERYDPNSGDPTEGSIILSTYYQDPNNGTFGPHKDTTIATNIPSPVGGMFMSTDLNGDLISDVVVNGQIWFGNADGSFRIGPSLGLSTAEKSATLTAGYLYNNGTAQDDLVLYPAPATSADPNSDAAQVFINDGTGSFTRGARVDLGAAGTTTGPLLITDLNADGTGGNGNSVPDIAVRISSGSNAPAMLVAQGSVNDGFIGNVVQPLPDNAQIFGTSGGFALFGFNSKVVSGVTKYSLETIPESEIVGPVITLSASSNSVFVGQRVVITADRTFTEPVGTPYTLLDGATVIGSTSVAADGSVTFAISSLAAGAHVLTAVSSSSPGDVSNTLTLTVNADPPTGLVFATGIQAGLRAVEVPGDVDTIKLSLRNIGGATATAPLNVQLFASSTTELASDAIPLPDTALTNLNPNLGTNKTKTISAKLTMPDLLVPGTYYLIAQVVSAKALTANQVIATTLVDFNSFQVAWQFGHVGSRQNVKFVQHLKNGSVVTFALTGSGYGVVTPGDGPLTLGNGGPDFEVNVAQTTIKSKLTISQTGSTKSNIVSLTLNNDVGTVDVHTDTPHTINEGPLDENGNALGTAIVSVKQLSIGTVPAATLVPTAIPTTSTVGDININGTLGQLSATAIDDTTIEVGANSSAPTSFKIGTLGPTASISSNVPIAEIDLTTAQSGSSISAPSLGKLKTSGNFSSTITLSGKTHGALVLGSVDIGGSVSGGANNVHTRWAVNGNIGDLRVRGSIANLDLLAGALVGPLGELTTPPAAFSGVSIKSLTVNGSVSSSLLSAGLDPVDGILLNGNDELLPGGSFGSITIGGVLSQDSKIVASNPPAQASVGKQKIATGSDLRFLLSQNT